MPDFSIFSDDDIDIINNTIMQQSSAPTNRRQPLLQQEEPAGTGGTLIFLSPGIPARIGAVLGLAVCQVFRLTTPTTTSTTSTTTTSHPTTTTTSHPTTTTTPAPFPSTMRILTPVLNPDGTHKTQTVYNAYTTAMIVGVYFQAKQSKTGFWLCENPNADPGMRDTTSACNCRNCVGCVMAAGCAQCHSGAPRNFVLMGIDSWNPYPTLSTLSARTMTCSDGGCTWLGTSVSITDQQVILRVPGCPTTTSTTSTTHAPGTTTSTTSTTTTTGTPPLTGVYAWRLSLASDYTTLSLVWISGADPLRILSGNGLVFRSHPIPSCMCAFQLDLEYPENTPKAMGDLPCFVCIAPQVSLSCCCNCFTVKWPGLGMTPDQVASCSFMSGGFGPFTFDPNTVGPYTFQLDATGVYPGACVCCTTNFTSPVCVWWDRYYINPGARLQQTSLTTADLTIWLSSVPGYAAFAGVAGGELVLNYHCDNFSCFGGDFTVVSPPAAMCTGITIPTTLHVDALDCTIPPKRPVCNPLDTPGTNALDFYGLSGINCLTITYVDGIGAGLVDILDGWNGSPPAGACVPRITDWYNTRDGATADPVGCPYGYPRRFVLPRVADGWQVSGGFSCGLCSGGGAIYVRCVFITGLGPRLRVQFGESLACSTGSSSTVTIFALIDYAHFSNGMHVDLFFIDYLGVTRPLGVPIVISW